MKVCKACGLEKPLTEFSKSRESYRGECKACRVAQHNSKLNKQPALNKESYRESCWVNGVGLHAEGWYYVNMKHQVKRQDVECFELRLTKEEVLALKHQKQLEWGIRSI